jgi:hypothetical protein
MWGWHYRMDFKVSVHPTEISFLLHLGLKKIFQNIIYHIIEKGNPRGICGRKKTTNDIPKE